MEVQFGRIDGIGREGRRDKKRKRVRGRALQRVLPDFLRSAARLHDAGSSCRGSLRAFVASSVLRGNRLLSLPLPPAAPTRFQQASGGRDPTAALEKIEAAKSEVEAAGGQKSAEGQRVLHKQSWSAALVRRASPWTLLPIPHPECHPRVCRRLIPRLSVDDSLPLPHELPPPRGGCPQARATGEKVLDDPRLLKKSIKRAEASKRKSAEAWKERVAVQQQGMDQRQQKRKDNLQARARSQPAEKMPPQLCSPCLVPVARRQQPY